MNTAAQQIARELFETYDAFKFAEIPSCRITHGELLKWLRPLKEKNLLMKLPLGTSGEGRTVSLYTFGEGSIKTMLWSQMHGDEPTATMALGDMFNFFTMHPGHILTTTIREKLTFLAIPMLNPDGAERFTRRTAQLVDINRDALALETPEARILRDAWNKYRPDYGFNLHDQDPRLTVGATKKIAAMALLAPPADLAGTDTPGRMRAKKVASTLAELLSLFIPGQIAKWEESYEPRAFGDTIQSWGTSTVLVESGGWKGDPNKFFIRKLNCVALLSVLYAIAIGETESAEIGIYEQIPVNRKLACDRIIRNALLQLNNQTAPLKVDIGINIETRKSASSGLLEEVATIVEIGDLRPYVALEGETDAQGAELDAARVILDHPFPASEIPQLLTHVAA